MPDAAELELLSTLELHDRAMDVARRRLDVPWVWRLLKAVPAAEAAAGNDLQARGDVASTAALLRDFLENADEGPLGEALRPMYVRYLVEHGDG
jgi:hypothetical protein